MTTQKSFDYIIVGAGATGCVVANRLTTKRQAEVLLLEAGEPGTNPGLHDLTGFVQLWGSHLDWKLSTEEQPALSGRRIVINQGKVVGGSSSLNAMMHVRGNRRNFDRWSDLGNEGWSFQDVLPYFKLMEDYEGGASEFHATGGPMTVRDCPDANARSEAFMNSAAEVGYDGPYWDYNGARQENGAGLLQFNITPDGQRHGAAEAYLAPIMDRPNLTVTAQAEVTRILTEGTRAVGVEYLRDGQTHQAYAQKEVIISAGAFLSPKLLMLSGIGPAADLRSHGIPVVVDLPGVGENLQDHLQLAVVYRSKVTNPAPTLLTGNVLFTNARPVTNGAPPDLQLNFVPAAPGPLLPVLPDFGGPVGIFLPIMVQPKSIGQVSLRSANPQDPPVINPNYLQSEADVQVFKGALNIIREIANAPAFGDLNGGELVPGEIDEEAYIRGNCSTLWHPAGTCRMGHDELAVVDPQLRVHGLEGLRVADASVMPTVTSGNTHVPALMIGEKLVDMI
ncbi:MAG: FAD-dependent oxidoreductase [Anaerolineae bacterium]|jgi:choline dehydrogenase|nr:FAD-dependent oxidoreductase [Anaerolineae bacterium]